MNVFDRRKYLKPIDEMKEDRLIPYELRPELVLDKENISLEVLRKIQDKHYEIDIEYEKTRDLFEK